MSRKMAKRLGVPREFSVYLKKEKPVVVPELPPRYVEPLFGGVAVSRKVFFGMADAYYTSMPVDGEGYDYQKILLDALDKMFRSPAKAVIIAIFRQDPVLLADLSAKSLYMDIYEPKGDTLSRRPLALLLHGGAFIIGDRAAKTISEVATALAEKGYVVASIDYRLGFNPGSKSSLERAAYRAVQDARAALRFLSAHADQYRIDMNHVFVAGSSAGAITALNTAFMSEEERPASTFFNFWRMQKDLGRLDESTNEFTGDWRIRAVANLWGAVHDTTLIDPWERIPVISFHGDKDDIVPIGYNFPFTTMDTTWTGHVVSKLYGSRPVSERLQSLGIHHRLVTFRGLGHEPQTEPLMYDEVMDTIMNGITGFFADAFFNWPAISGPDTLRATDPVASYSVPYMFGHQYYWKVNGGKIVGRNLEGNRIEAVWIGENPEAEVIMVNPVGAAKTFHLLSYLE